MKAPMKSVAAERRIVNTDCGLDQSRTWNRECIGQWAQWQWWEGRDTFWGSAAQSCGCGSQGEAHLRFSRRDFTLECIQYGDKRLQQWRGFIFTWCTHGSKHCIVQQICKIISGNGKEKILLLEQSRNTMRGWILLSQATGQMDLLNLQVKSGLLLLTFFYLTSHGR